MKRCPNCGACSECGHVAPGVNPFPMQPMYPGTYPGPVTTPWPTTFPVTQTYLTTWVH